MRVFVLGAFVLVVPVFVLAIVEVSLVRSGPVGIVAALALLAAIPLVLRAVGRRAIAWWRSY